MHAITILIATLLPAADPAKLSEVEHAHYKRKDLDYQLNRGRVDQIDKLKQELQTLQDSAPQPLSKAKPNAKEKRDAKKAADTHAKKLAELQSQIAKLEAEPPAPIPQIDIAKPLRAGQIGWLVEIKDGKSTPAVAKLGKYDEGKWQATIGANAVTLYIDDTLRRGLDSTPDLIVDLPALVFSRDGGLVIEFADNLDKAARDAEWARLKAIKDAQNAKELAAFQAEREAKRKAKQKP